MSSPPPGSDAGTLSEEASVSIQATDAAAGAESAGISQAVTDSATLGEVASAGAVVLPPPPVDAGGIITADDLAELQAIAVELMPDRATLYRLQTVGGDTDYYPVGDPFPVSIFPPGLTPHNVRAVVPGGNQFPFGGCYAPVGISFLHKDRLIVLTQGNREWEVLAALTPQRYPTQLLLSIREVQIPERELWLVYMPAGRTGLSSSLEAPASIVKVLPRPLVMDDQIETVSIGDQDGMETAVLARYAVTEIPYAFLASQPAPSFCLIVTAGVDVEAEDIQDGVYPTYRYASAPQLLPAQWGVPPEWKLSLVQVN